MNTWNTDSSPYSGPSSANATSQLLFDELHVGKFLDPLTMLMTNDNKYVWASSLTGVFKFRVDADKMVEVGYLYRDINLEFHGAYAFVSKEDEYFTAGNDYIAVYTNKDQTDPESPIVMVRRLNMTNFHSDEHLVGLSLTYDGYLVFTTDY